MICDCRAEYVQCNWIFVCVRQVYRCAGVLSPTIGQDVDDIVTAKTSSNIARSIIVPKYVHRSLHGGGYFHNPLVGVHNDFSEDGE